MFGQPMKDGLKISNLPDDAIEDIFTEEGLEKVVSGEHGGEQSNLTQDPVEEINVKTPDGTSNNPIHRNGNKSSPFFINVCQA